MNKRELLLQKVYLIRGQFLQHSIELEHYIDAFLCKHFTKDVTKQTELLGLVLVPRLTFDNKFQVFKFLIEQHYPQIEKMLPKFSKSFKSIIEWRNMMAHYPIDLTDEAVAKYAKDDTISIIKIKNSSDKPLGPRLSSIGTFKVAELEEQVKLIQLYASRLLMFLK